MTRIAVLHGWWSRDADDRGAYDALGEEFGLARSLIDARATVRLTQPQHPKSRRRRVMHAANPRRNAVH